jgi:DNA-binding PadR family transcriptional regulator
VTHLGHPAHRLGPVQRHVLRVLAIRGECARSDWGAWYPLDVSQVYGAMEGLGRRGLVDVAGFDGRSRTFRLTSRGLEVANQMDEIEEEP